MNHLKLIELCAENNLKFRTTFQNNRNADEQCQTFQKLLFDRVNLRNESKTFQPLAALWSTLWLTVANYTSKSTKNNAAQYQTSGATTSTPGTDLWTAHKFPRKLTTLVRPLWYHSLCSTRWFVCRSFSLIRLFLALKSKADPPKIRGELIRVLEPLGQVSIFRKNAAGKFWY